MSGKKRSSAPRKHAPQRTCIVCRQKTDKRRLTRIVNNPVEGVVADPSGKKNGRGAYICQNVACREAAIASNILDVFLKIKITSKAKATLAQFWQSDE